MITFVVVAPHDYTVAALQNGVLGPLVPKTRAITYDQLFAVHSVTPGTWVFTDMERLNTIELKLAAKIYRRMANSPNIRILNDPARVKSRFGLLRALHDAGFNDFNAYWADSLERPKRFPVFLKIAAEHTGSLGALINDQAELDLRLQNVVAQGTPLSTVLIIEYCGAPSAHGYYERYAFFKVGTEISLSGILIDDQWIVKNPRFDLMTPKILADQFDAMRENRYLDEMKTAFDIAEIEYGRADVGLVNGRLQVYEINTNPNISATTTYISNLHRKSRELPRARFGKMLHDVDLPDEGNPTDLRFKGLDKETKFRMQRALQSTLIQWRIDSAPNKRTPYLR